MRSIKNRVDLADYFNDLGFKTGAEIGVAEGRYSEILCQKIPGLMLDCVDPWAPYSGNWRSREDQDKAYDIAKKRLSKYNAKLHKQESLAAALLTGIAPPGYDFVFIDGAHDFDNVMLDILVWSPLVRKGGIVAGHDYYESHQGTVQVVPAVDAYVKAHKIQLNIIPMDEGAHKDDRVPVWWFKK